MLSSVTFIDDEPLLPLLSLVVDSVSVSSLPTRKSAIFRLLATLFLTLGGARYLMASGDPGEVEAAKRALKAAAIGYGIAVLAPVILEVLQGIIGAGGKGGS